MANTNGRPIGAESLARLLHRTGEILAERGESAEIALYGGSAILLTTGNREATRDVDFVPIVPGSPTLDEAAAIAGEEAGIGRDWLSDAVSVFASETPEYVPVGMFPPEAPGLRVLAASPRYMLAMKAMALRSAIDSDDAEDVWNLLEECGVRTVDEAERLIAWFYPGSRLPQRQALVLADIMEAREKGESFSRALAW